MRHVIIEGPDGAGKTELARRLCACLGFAYHHEGPPPQGANLLHHYGRQLVEAAQPTVFDRFYLGEFIYGPLLRGESGLDEYDDRLLERVVRGTGTTVILCLPPFETCMTNCEGRKELLTREQRIRAYGAWVTLAKRHTHLIKVYNYERPTAVITCGGEWTCPNGVIGNPAARVLLIGEQPNGDLDLPFFSRAGSSRFLNTALETVFDESELAFTNAKDAKGDTRDLEFIIQQMPNLHTAVGLGVVAQRALEVIRKPRVRLYAMPHPSFWKRFHHNEIREYIRMLEGVHAS